MVTIVQPIESFMGFFVCFINVEENMKTGVMFQPELNGEKADVVIMVVACAEE
ncbi:MAG TPA: hypothetical protein VLF89_06660 [Candidatus Saccharimonadales bacterium]|nr:hypothetical protein [Candidatus Saccharimonadales bacterium]